MLRRTIESRALVTFVAARVKHWSRLPHEQALDAHLAKLQRQESDEREISSEAQTRRRRMPESFGNSAGTRGTRGGEEESPLLKDEVNLAPSSHLPGFELPVRPYIFWYIELTVHALEYGFRTPPKSGGSWRGIQISCFCRVVQTAGSRQVQRCPPYGSDNVHGPFSWRWFVFLLAREPLGCPSREQQPYTLC